MCKGEFYPSFVQVSGGGWEEARICVFSIYEMIVTRLHPIIPLLITRWELFFKVFYSHVVGT